MSNGITVSFTIGGRRYQRQEVDPLIGQKMADAMVSRYSNMAFRDITRTLPKLARDMERAGNAELLLAIPKMMELIGRDGSRDFEFGADVLAQGAAGLSDSLGRDSIDDRFSFDYSQTGRNSLYAEGGSIFWQKLADTTFFSKQRKARTNPDGFFEDRGPLKAAVARAAPKLAQATGGVRVTLSTKDLEAISRQVKTSGAVGAGAKLVLGALKIEIAPKMTAYRLPALASRQWTEEEETGRLERSLVPRGQVHKLVGPEGAHRPLMQPVVAFWVLHRIPRAMARTLELSVNRSRGHLNRSRGANN